MFNIYLYFAARVAKSSLIIEITLCNAWKMRLSQ